MKINEKPADFKNCPAVLKMVKVSSTDVRKQKDQNSVCGKKNWFSQILPVFSAIFKQELPNLGTAQPSSPVVRGKLCLFCASPRCQAGRFSSCCLIFSSSRSTFSPSGGRSSPACNAIRLRKSISSDPSSPSPADCMTSSTCGEM